MDGVALLAQEQSQMRGKVMGMFFCTCCSDSHVPGEKGRSHQFLASQGKGRLYTVRILLGSGPVSTYVVFSQWANKLHFSCALSWDGEIGMWLVQILSSCCGNVEVALDLTGGNKLCLRGFNTLMLVHKSITFLERDH